MIDVNGRLIRAVQLATHTLAGHGEFDSLLKRVLRISVNAVGAEGGTIYLHDPATKRLIFQHVEPPDVEPRLPMRDIADDFGMAGEAFQKKRTVLRDMPPRTESDLNPFEIATGIVVRNMVATPLMMEQEDPIGVVQLLNKSEGPFNETDGAVLDTIASVATMAYLNYRLSEESARASTLLGMGKVSHDIGNLAASLYASLSFSEMAICGLKDSLTDHNLPMNAQENLEALDPMVEDLKKSVDRIVGYSRLISDMSAGRGLRPNFTLGSMADTIQRGAAYLETESRSKHVDLVYEIDLNAPETYFDDLFVFRIVQNLVGNSVKAVYEIIPDEKIDGADEDDTFGSVTVRYQFRDGEHVFEVSDTGPGMTREVANRILSGNARSQWSKAGGSGWGTKIVLELAVSHGGVVEIDSVVGQGSTFRVRFPHREMDS
ncbi:MAG: GAF domain-containing sensor histidine kinase [Armatimonadetes bacterium]|nr:GAF domain-containing sensor histidine kinase [Armatimonadota bacterium]